MAKKQTAFGVWESSRPLRLQSPIKVYYLSPGELEYYRNLPKPIKERNICTTAPRNVKKRRERG